MMIVKTLMYTGIHVSELINIRLTDIDFHYRQVRINNGKGGKDRIVPFSQSFKELLAMHADAMKKKHAVYLFESSWKKKYTDRGIRKILAKYSEEAGRGQNLSPHKLRHFLLTWLKSRESMIRLYNRIPDMKAESHWKSIQNLQSPMPSRNITRLSINSPFNYIYFALGDSYAGITLLKTCWHRFRKGEIYQEIVNISNAGNFHRKIQMYVAHPLLEY